MKKLQKKRGGQVREIRSSDLQGIYKEIADIVGVEITKIIFQQLKGQQITFPTHLYEKSYVIQEVNSRYDGTNLRELAHEFNYTERWIRTFVRKERVLKEKENEKWKI